MQTVRVGLAVMILKEGKVLLGHRSANRKDTGGIFEPDTWNALPEELFTEHTATGAYLIGAEQLGNEQVLTLTQIDNGFGALSYLMPGADEDTQEFILHRYIGSAN